MNLNITNNVDLNNQPDPYLQNASQIFSPTTERIINIATPFFALYTPTKNIMTVGLGLAHSWKIMKGNDVFFYKLFQLSVCVGHVAISILFPVITGAGVTILQIGSNGLEMFCSIRNAQWKEASLCLLAIVNLTLRLGSMALGGTELLFVSLLAQAVKELYQAYKELQVEGRKPEYIAALLMALIRIVQATIHGRTLQRNYFGQKLTQVELNKILQGIHKTNEATPEKSIDFDKILQEKNLSSRLEKLVFTTPTDVKALSNITFNNLRFTQCKFQQIQFEKTAFINVKAGYCEFIKTIFADTTFTNSSFYTNRFNYSGFANVTIRNSFFEETDFFFTGFTNTHFKGTMINECYFSSSQFVNTTWNHSIIEDNSFVDTHHTNSVFKNSSLDDSNFAYGKFDQVQFKDVELLYVAFNNGVLKNVTFENSSLQGVSFLDATAEETHINNCDLTNTIFAGTENQFLITGGIPQHFTGPIIGIQWDFNWVGNVTKAGFQSLKQSGSVPLRFDKGVPGVSVEEFDQEVEQALEDLAAQGLPEGALSIPDAIYKQAAEGSILHNLYARVERISTHVQGIFMPGGADINPKFYGKEITPVYYVDKNHQRTMTEFAVASITDKKGLPVLAICRGSQIFNVFRGGTLKEDIENHSGVTHQLTIKPEADPVAASVIRDIIGEHTDGYSNHHQALDSIGKDLHVVIEHEGDVEGTVSLDGRVILLQFHPEMFYYSRQEALLTSFGFEPSNYTYHKGKLFFENLTAKANAFPAIPAGDKIQSTMHL